MDFSEMSFRVKCDVCGSETDVIVCASTMGAISNKYCKDCLNNGLESYDNMVAYISCAGKYPNDINPKYIEHVRKILTGLGKTEEQFIIDVNKSIEEINQWYKDMEAYVDDECGE